jgi:hypothetical protein
VVCGLQLSGFMLATWDAKSPMDPVDFVGTLG